MRNKDLEEFSQTVGFEILQSLWINKGRIEGLREAVVLLEKDGYTLAQGDIEARIAELEGKE